MVTIKTWSQNSGWAETTGTTSATGIQKNPKKEYLILYVDYVKGDEASLDISFSYKDVTIVDKTFKMSRLEGDRVEEMHMYLDKTGTYVIPVPMPISAQMLYINASLAYAGASPGTANLWVKP